MKTVVIAQCRLSSSRLPGKALLPLGGKTILEWVLSAMKKVSADDYYLAVDYESEKALSPLAEKCGWKICAGPLEDVLKRYLMAIEESKADLVIRATCDNPFLFYEAADSLLKEFLRREQSHPCDYITYTGLPHGSGIEIFKSLSLKKASENNNSSYEHEHVGPALYNHKEFFNCQFIKSPKRWYYPDLRTTVDTEFDYFKAVNLCEEMISKKKNLEPFTTEEILEGLALESVKLPLLFIPCTEKGRGTGHLRRCLDLALKTKGRIYISKKSSLEDKENLIEEYKAKGLKEIQITEKLCDLEKYSLIVTDPFISSSEDLKNYSALSKVLSIDDGNSKAEAADYLLNILPALDNKKEINLSDTSFIPLAKNKKVISQDNPEIKKVIVSVGGEDPLDLAEKASLIMSEAGYKVTLVKRNAEIKKDNDIHIIEKIENLKEHLYEYDLCITHFGFTAFEASSAGIKVLLISSSDLHEKLALKYDFVCVKKGQLNKENLLKAVKEVSDSSINNFFAKEKDLSLFIREIASGIKMTCPVCRKKEGFSDEVIARTSERTFRRCRNCGMQYISYTKQSFQTEYNRDYFFEDYKKQYGKTYLDDFDSIKVQCKRRIEIINSLYKNHSPSSVILDIGCAMGPFLKAAAEAGWQTYGTDISKDAVEYIQQNLNFPASCSSFPDFDSIQEFGIDKYDAVTMWYVIEHFKNLDSVLKAVSSLLKKGGIFAFSTPSASGVSAKYNKKSFYENSPSDHYSLWEIEKVKGILSSYGFKVLQTVSTGIHPERHPAAFRHNWTEKDFKFRLLKKTMEIKKSGDTFEVYCKKL